MMLLRYRRRHASYPLAQASVVPGITRRAITLVIVALLLFLTASWVLNRFGTDSAFRRAASLIAIEERGTVNVSLEGNPPQRGQSAMKLYAGDLLTTGSDAHAAVRFFDGSIVRLDESSEVMISESRAGEEEESLLTLDLRKGSMWVTTPDLSAFSGAIKRTVTTPALTFELPPATEALLGSDSLTVFSADGIGITVTLHDADRTLVVGEGQQWKLPAVVDEETDLYATRAALDPLVASSPFIEESRTKVRGLAIHASRRGDEHGASSSATIVVTNTSPSQEHVLITAPVITSPAASGQTYRTEKVELVLRGTASKDAAGIMVNDYQLKLFTPEKGSWSYLASLELGNLKAGTNTYDVFTLDSLGRKSDPVRITIIQGEGPEGVVAPGEGSGQGSSQAPLQNNAPLTPGILAVTAPEPGTSMTYSGTGFLLEGTTSAATHSIWVNDYRLQLYTPGKTFWNYIASEELQTLKPGRNVYRIVARNEKGEVLDVLEYIVEKK